MANFRYFADTAEGTFERTGVWNDGVGSKARNFFGTLPSGQRKVAATRVIEMKRHPVRHECDARGFNASGRVMKCECSCGGKNHGRGAFACVEAAA